jgi:hypothetical protein
MLRLAPILRHVPTLRHAALTPPTWRTLARNGFLLLVPVMIWDSLLTASLPPVYGNSAAWGAAHPELATGESLSRWLVVLLPVLMPIGLVTRRQRIGFVVWVAGTAAYFAAWIAVIAWPDSAWSRSAIGFLAPAYLAYPWLVGIGMMSDRLYVRSPYRWWQYVALSTVFVAFHTAHFVTIWPG